MLPEPQVQTIEYPGSDGGPMGETGFHVTLIAFLLTMLGDYVGAAAWRSGCVIT